MYNKLSKSYMLDAIIGTQWTPMSPCDGFFLQKGDSTIKVKIPQSQTVKNKNPNQFSNE